MRYPRNRVNSNAGFGRPQHHHRIDVGQVNTLVEHVDREYNIELAIFEPLKGCGSRVTRRT
jgi:hypothetical protein